MMRPSASQVLFFLAHNLSDECRQCSDERGRCRVAPTWYDPNAVEEGVAARKI